GFMANRYRSDFVASLVFPPYESSSGHSVSLLKRMIELAPVTLPLGLLGAIRAIRSALVDEYNTLETIGGSLWVIWLAVASMAPAIWPSGSHNSFDLILLVPLDLLAAQTIADFVNRRIAVGALIWLIPATMLCIGFWASTDLNRALSVFIDGH